MAVTAGATAALAKQMEPMLDRFETTAKHVAFKAPSVPVISPLLGSCVFDGKTFSAKYLRNATRQAVNFVGALEAAEEMGSVDAKTVWIDVGPHPVCASFVRNRIEKAKVVPSLRRGEDNWATLSASLCQLHLDGLPVAWNELHRPFEVPGGTGTAVAGIIACVSLAGFNILPMVQKALNGDPLPMSILGVYCLVGAAVYALYGYRHSKLARGEDILDTGPGANESFAPDVGHPLNR